VERLRPAPRAACGRPACDPALAGPRRVAQADDGSGGKETRAEEEHPPGESTAHGEPRRKSEEQRGERGERADPGEADAQVAEAADDHDAAAPGPASTRCG